MRVLLYDVEYYDILELKKGEHSWRVNDLGKGDLHISIGDNDTDLKLEFQSDYSVSQSGFVLEISVIIEQGMEYTVME